jgi:polysaccharide biosynthesis/export protein
MMKSRIAVGVIIVLVGLFIAAGPRGAVGAENEPSGPAAEAANTGAAAPPVPGEATPGAAGSPAAPAAGAGVPAGYVIGPGDLLDISVWKDESLTQSVYVLPDGKISFPLIGEVAVAGLTVATVKKELEERLARYVPGAVLSLKVAQVNSLLIYVIGRVNNPGRFSLNANVDVLQALAIAGGLHPYAKRGRIRIFRHDGAKTVMFPFDYDDVADGSKLEQNIMLKRGDVIVVP